MRRHLAIEDTVLFASSHVRALFERRARTDYPQDIHAAMLAPHSNAEVHIREHRDALVVIPPEWRYGHDHRANLDRYLLAPMDASQSRAYSGPFLVDGPALLVLLQWGAM